LVTGQSFVLARTSADHITTAIANELTTHQALAVGNGLTLRRGGVLINR